MLISILKPGKDIHMHWIRISILKNSMWPYQAQLVEDAITTARVRVRVRFHSHWGIP